MPATTAQELIDAAFNTATIFAPGQTVPTLHYTRALARLNRMMGQLKLQPLTQPVTARDVFPLMANQGGPSNPYTVGPGGDFDIPRPIKLSGVGLLLVQATPATTIEIPRGQLTDDGYQALRLKDLPNTLFTYARYEPSFTDDWGSLFLYPVPDNALNSIVLYRNEPLAYFTGLATSYDLPDGAAEALETNLARRLLTPYGITDQGVVSDVLDQARTSLANFKRANVKLSDLPNDAAAIGGNVTGLYNITTGDFG